MFLQACVCPQGGVPDQVHPPEQTPPGSGTPPRTRYPPIYPGTRYTPRTRYTPQDQVHPPDPGTPPRPGTPPGPGNPPGPGTPPRDTATAANGTHPTGMHSCLLIRHSFNNYAHNLPCDPVVKSKCPVGLYLACCFFLFFPYNNKHHLPTRR